MSCGKCLLYIINTLEVGLCLGLLGLGLSTGLTLLTYVACGGLIIGLLCWGGLCTGNRCMLLSYTWCMFTLTVMCLCFIISPQTGKSVVGEPLEQFILAVYMKSGTLEDLPCCPKIPLERPRDWESLVVSKVMGAGNELLCAGTKLVGVLTCKDFVDLILDTYGTPLALAAAVLMFTSGVNTWYEVRIVLKRRRDASPTW
ncbi:uncharacterized protein LOC121734887 isoform X1 [Aricia agestis]|uniref:uncharacterized protein LOC121734887 isoform X1 n=1 Tax=Aricia agestis TaxID=91739 RepID=UPI001C2094DD|nr:uncharacterized protein LOC121734887 isoform X1 [Aricia agestis]